MNLHSRHMGSDYPTPQDAKQPAPSPGRTAREAGDARESGARARLSGLVLTTTATSVTAGALYWHWTRNLSISLGAVLLAALVGIVATWLHAREETRRVQAREHGATERERIRHYAEIQLAEAQKILITATTCGPNSTPDEARAVRLDAQKIFDLLPPTTLSDAMRITRTQEPDGQRPIP